MVCGPVKSDVGLGCPMPVSTGSHRLPSLCLALVVHTGGRSAQGRYALKLLNDLMEDYSSALRPVEDTDKALNVTLQVTLSQIKDMVSPAAIG